MTFTGGLAEQAGNVLGAGSTAVTVWNIAKWPVILAAAKRKRPELDSNQRPTP